MVSFTSRPLYLQEKSPRIGGWVGPRIGLDIVAKRKNPFTVLDWNQTSLLKPVA
jgi:hypothetical protein